LHQSVDHADVPGGSEYSQLGSLIHRVHIITHEIAAKVEINRVKFPIMRKIFFLVTHELSDEIPRDRDEDNLKRVMQDRLMVG
jgi:hypothetical protein